MPPSMPVLTCGTESRGFKFFTVPALSHFPHVSLPMRPLPGSVLTLRGAGAFDAAVHCAAVSAVKRRSTSLPPHREEPLMTAGRADSAPTAGAAGASEVATVRPGTAPTSETGHAAEEWMQQVPARLPSSDLPEGQRATETGGSDVGRGDGCMGRSGCGNGGIGASRSVQSAAGSGSGSASGSSSGLGSGLRGAWKALFHPH